METHVERQLRPLRLTEKGIRYRRSAVRPRRPGLHGSVALVLLSLVVGVAQPAQSQTEENSEPAITVSIEGPDEVSEHAGTATLTVRAATTEDRRPTQAVDVHIAPGGSATEFADYDIPSLYGSSYLVTLAPEAFSRSSDESHYVATHELIAYIFDDNEDEPAETIVTTPGDSDAPDHVTFAAAHTLSILDNDEPAITISFEGPSQIDEGGGSTTISVQAATATVLAPEQPIRFHVRIRGTAKPPGVNYVADFESTAFPYRLTFAADAFKLSTDGSRYVAAFEFTVVITDDTEDEPDETIELSIDYAPLNVTSAAPHTLTILDNDTSLAIANGTAEESAGTMPFAVATSSPSTNAVIVEYSTADGTATSGTDYTSVSGTLTFPAGSIAAQSIQVPSSPTRTTKATRPSP